MHTLRKVLPPCIFQYFGTKVEFCDELTFTYADRSPIENTASAANAPAVDSTFPATSSGKGDVYRNNMCEDNFNQVYCEYINQNDVPDLMSMGDPSSISIFHSNVISLHKNLNKVEEVFSDCKNYSCIIAISETGLDDDIESEHIKIEGYHKFERNDSLTCKGGVGVYVTDQLDYEPRDDLKLNVLDCEDVWLEIQTIPDENQARKNNDKSFVVGVIYRHPDRLYRSFTYKLCQTIEKLNRAKTKFMIVGDINIDLLKYSLARNITDYTNKLKSSGCNVHCNIPTRIIQNSRSCIDHVYSNFEQHTVDTSVILSDISDHFSTLSKFSAACSYNKKPKNVYKRKFRLNEEEERNFCSELNTLLNNDAVRSISSCPNIMAKILIQSYQNLINKYFPLKKVSKKALKFIHKPWLTKGLKISIRNKNRLSFKLRKKILLGLKLTLKDTEIS